MPFDVVRASFRDPDGFLFMRDGTLYRQVNRSYSEDYDLLMGSGLYDELVGEGLLVPHTEADISLRVTDDAYRVIAPEPVPFVSYPYEWCFSALKDAALITIDIQKRALEHGMSLKDASAYNVQLMHGRPTFIDTLSFEKYPEGRPWVAYKQFCMHFLAPLALMSYLDIRFNQWMQVSIDGVALDLASKILPSTTWLRPSMLMHIHMHAKSQLKYAGEGLGEKKERKISKFALVALADSLRGAVERLDWKKYDTEWADYYHDTNYSDEGMEHKRRLVAEYLDAVKPSTVWDMGGNTGEFSRIASSKGIDTVSFDIDPSCIEKSYRDMRANGEKHIVPLLYDATNPSPDIGWDNAERSSVTARGPADAVLALALVHHLAISNNVPLVNVAEYFSRLGGRLIIEFVPKDDSQVQRLLTTREDIFPNYTREGFEESFGRYFRIAKSTNVKGSKRVLYLMEKLS